MIEGMRAVVAYAHLLTLRVMPGRGGGQEAHEGGSSTGLLPAKLAAGPVGGA